MPPFVRALPLAALLVICACNRNPAPTAGTLPANVPSVAPTSVAAVADALPTDVRTRIERVLGDADSYAAAIEKLRQAVRSNNAVAVAGLIQYPIDVAIEGRVTTIPDSRSFAQHYDQIITADIAAAVTGTQYADLMVNQRGIMFGNGEVWINGVCEDDKCQRFEPRVIAIQTVNAAQSRDTD